MTSPFSDNELEEFRWFRRAAIKWAAVGLVAVILLTGAGFAISQVWRRTTAPIEGRTAQVEAVEGNADFRIQSYEWFFDQCAAIQTSEDVISNQMDEMDGASEDRQAQIRTNLVAQRNRRSSLIRSYNQEARKAETTGQFRFEGLPSTINPNTERTECV